MAALPPTSPRAAGTTTVPRNHRLVVEGEGLRVARPLSSTWAVESGACGVRWDLTPLAPSEDAMRERLRAGKADAAAFVERWSANSLDTIEPTRLRALLRELA